MASTKIYDFATTSEWTYDSDKIEIINDIPYLKPVSNASQTFTEDFADDTGFTYNSVEVEFSGGLLQQKNVRQTNGTAGGVLDTSMDLDWGDGYLPVVGSTGGAAIVGGELDLTGSPYDKSVRYGGASNSPNGIKTITFKYIPNYSGIPSSDRFLYTQNNNNGVKANGIQLKHNAITGTMTFEVYDFNATAKVNETSVAAVTLVSGIEYKIQLVIDGVASTSRVLIDDVAIVEDTTTTYTNNAPQAIWLGADWDHLTFGSDAYYTDFLIESGDQQSVGDYNVYANLYAESKVDIPSFVYSGVGYIQSLQSVSADATSVPKVIIGDKYWTGSAWATSDGTYAQATAIATANSNVSSLDVEDTSSLGASVVFSSSDTQEKIDNLTVGYTGQIYSTDNPAISVANAARFWAEDILTFSAVTSVTGADSIGMIMVNGGTKYYWVGSTLTASNGTYTQSNTPAEVTANVTSLAASRTSIGMDIFLHSDDGSTTPSITSTTFTYDAALPDPTSARLVDVNGYIYDNNGAVEGSVVQIRPYLKGFNNPSDGSGGGVFHLYDWRDLGTSLADGFFSGGVYLQTSGQYWELKIGKQRYRVAFIDKDANDLNELTLTLIED